MDSKSFLLMYFGTTVSTIVQNHCVRCGILKYLSQEQLLLSASQHNTLLFHFLGIWPVEEKKITWIHK